MAFPLFGTICGAVAVNNLYYLKKKEVVGRGRGGTSSLSTLPSRLFKKNYKKDNLPTSRFHLLKNSLTRKEQQNSTRRAAELRAMRHHVCWSSAEHEGRVKGAGRTSQSRRCQLNMLRIITVGNHLVCLTEMVSNTSGLLWLLPHATSY